MSVGCGFLLIWMITMLQSHFPFSTACLPDERSYLLDFKAGLNLSSAHLSSWAGFNCCQWEGVRCDYHTSHVIRLHLSADWYSQQFSGEVRPSLFNLHQLQHLHLSGIDFKGVSIPPQLSKLQRLTFLSLSNVGFSGEVPLELGNMSSLRHLDISSRWSYMLGTYYYFISSSKFDVWVRNLRSLEFLGMTGVNLTMASKQWGEALSGLANLTQIHLPQCGLSGNIPDLLNLTHLSHLHIADNAFPSELPSWFENVSSLVSLDLTYCHLKGSIPSNFMPRSKLRNLVLDYNGDLKGKLAFFLNHSSSLVVLSLAYCSLGGVIFPVIANFSKLEILDLRWNSFQGGIPSYFDSPSSLEFLDLRGNNLEGSIPSSFDSLSSLATLDFSYNQLTGQIPPSLCQLPALRALRLGHNQLSGTIPDCILNLASLQVLSLPSNRFAGNISLQLFDNLTGLQELYLSENEFLINISTSWVPQFPQLRVLGLRFCNIEGDLPAFLSQQFQLQALDLSGNNIVGNLPSWLWDLPNLYMLNLSNNNLEGSLPRKISHTFTTVDLHGNRLNGSLPAIDFVYYMLDLSDNEFTGSIPAPNCNLLFLSLSGNNLTGEIPSFTCTDPNGLEILILSKNKLTGMIPANIGRCSKLRVLNLAQNVLQREIPEELGNLEALRTLNLNGNSLQGTIPSSIANCITLQVFDLGNNKFEGNIPIWIEELTDLRILYLASNKFEGSIPSQLIKLQNLQILDLSDNNLSGSIPPDLSKLYAMVSQSQSIHVQHSSGSHWFLVDGFDHLLEYVDDVTVWIKGRALKYEKIISADKFIDLSHNNLSGNIPPELGLLKGLISFNISNNNLSGSIPESLGAMAQLESLDLSENKLSGKIPYQLLNLTFLEVLNLSNNMLSGLIPQGKQFSTFEAASFSGNPKLHGPPLENRTLSSRENQTEWNNTVTEDADADVDVMDRWWEVGLGLSYGVGFATVIAVLCFHIKWRYRCFALMDSLIYYLFER